MIQRHRGIITQCATPSNYGRIFDGHVACFYKFDSSTQSFGEGDLVDYTIAISQEGREAVMLLAPTGSGPNSDEARLFAGLPPLNKDNSDKAEAPNTSNKEAENTDNKGDFSKNQQEDTWPLYRAPIVARIYRDMDRLSFENAFQDNRRLLVSAPLEFSCTPRTRADRIDVEKHLLALTEKLGFNVVLSNDFKGGIPGLENLVQEQNDLDDSDDEYNAIHTYSINAVLGYFIEEYSDTPNKEISQKEVAIFKEKANHALLALENYKREKSTSLKAVLIIASIALALLGFFLWHLWNGGNFILEKLFG